MSATTTPTVVSVRGLQPTPGAITGGGRPLTNEAVFRIEVSLSSRKTSAIVMRTTARLYSLESSQGQSSPTGPPDDVQWKSVAYGAPCIQLMRETTEHNSPFHIKIVIAEVESGISLWEGEVLETSGYNAMQTNFHTFSANGKTFAVQFANDGEAERMLESIHDLFLQKQKAETVSFEKKPDEVIFKKPKNFRRLSKKDISTPCNFKHVSGITVQRTQTCEDELRGTIQRKMRSMSMSNLTGRKVKRSKQPSEMVDGGGHTDERERPAVDVSPGMGRKGESMRSRSGSSIRSKFGSLRITKKKAYANVSLNGKTSGVTVTELPPEDSDQFSRGDSRMSLPSHFRRQTRPPLNTNTFVQGPSPDRGPGRTDRKSPIRALSMSSGDLLGLSGESRKHPSGSNLERRHTVVLDQHSPARRVNQYNYVPYSANMAGGRAATIGSHASVPQQTGHQRQLDHRQFSSDASLNRINPAAYNRGGVYGSGSRQIDRRTSLAEMQVVPMDNGGMSGPMRSGMSASAAHIHPGGGAAPTRQYNGHMQSVPDSRSNPSIARVPSSGGIPTPAQVVMQQRYNQAQGMRVPVEAHYQTPPTMHPGNYQTPNNVQLNYQTPSHNVQIKYQAPNGQQNYQIPSGMQVSGVPVTNPDIHYQTPAPQNRASSSPERKNPNASRKGDNPVPYAVVGVGSASIPPQVAGQITQSGAVVTGPPPASTASNVPQPQIQTMLPVQNGGIVSVQPPMIPSQMAATQQGRQREIVQLPHSPTHTQSNYDILNPRDRPLPPTPQQYQQQQLQMMQQQQRNKYHNVNLRKQQSQPVFRTAVPDPNNRGQPSVNYNHGANQAPLGRADVQISPSHAQSKVAPLPSQATLHGLQEQAFSSSTSNGYSHQPYTQHTGSSNNTSRGNSSTPPRSSPRFQPGSKLAYDTLPAANSNPGARDSLASGSSSVADLEHYTDAMTKALEQFDSLLQPQQEKKQIIQTSL